MTSTNDEDFLAPWMKIFVISVVIVGEIVAYTLFPMIIFYEKNGEDPQKRTILNMLISQMCYATMGINLMPTNAVLLRLIIGHPLDETLIWAIFIMPKSVLIILFCFIFSEFYLIRALTICWWRSIPPFEEIFFNQFLINVNVTLSIFLALVQNLALVKQDVLHLFMSKQMVYDESIPSYGVFNALAIVTFFIGVISQIFVMAQKRKERPPQVINTAGPTYNTASKNKSLNTSSAIILNIVLVALIVCTLHYSKNVGDANVPQQLTIEYFLLIFVQLSFVTPIFVLAKNPCIWKCVKKQLYN